MKYLMIDPRETLPHILRHLRSDKTSESRPTFTISHSTRKTAKRTRQNGVKKAKTGKRTIEMTFKAFKMGVCVRRISSKKPERTEQSQTLENVRVMRGPFQKARTTLENLYQRHAARVMFARWTPLYEHEVADNQYSAADQVAAYALKHIAKVKDEGEAAIVDAGIGTGLLAQQLYDALPCKITGLDFTADMMSICSAREITELLIHCDVGRDHWPVENASQDLVVSAGLTEYLTADMMEHFLKESSRVLNEKGLLVYTYLPREEGERSTHLWHGHSGTYLTCGYTPERMEKMIEKSGLTLREHTPAFRGCLFHDGSSYDYRLIVAQRL